MPPFLGYLASKESVARALVLFALLAAASLSGCLSFWTGAVDEPAPAWELVDIDGNNRSLGSYEGRYVLLDFMGTWCDICQRSRSNLVAINESHDVAILSVSATDSAGQLDTFRHQFTNPWPLAVDTWGLTRNVTEAMGGNRVIYPSYALVDPDGRITFWNQGETFPAVVAARIIDREPVAVPWLWGFVAVGLGVVAYHTPFLTNVKPGRWFPLAALIGGGLFAFMVAYGAAPLSPRLFLPYLVAAAASIPMVWWARQGHEAKIREGRGFGADQEWRRDGTYLAAMPWYGAPAFFLVVQVALKQAAPLAAAVPVVAFAVGLALATRLPKPPRWATETGLIAAGLVLGLRLLVS